MGAVAVIGSLAFIGWLAWRAAKKKPIKAHLVSYGVSCIAGIFTFAFFMGMDLPDMVKILVCIVLGGLLILVAARSQQRVSRDER